MLKRFLPITALLLVSSCTFFGPTYADVTLRNDTSENISRVSIMVTRHRYELTDLSPGEARTISFTTAGDDSFNIGVTFESGRELKTQSLGYLTEGIQSRDTIRILPRSFELDTDIRPDAESPLPLTGPSD
jgi:hypothetical protein